MSEYKTIMLESPANKKELFDFFVEAFSHAGIDVAKEMHEANELTTQKIANNPKYSDDLIVIQNRLLHAISRLSVNERRLVLLLSRIVRRETAENPRQRTFYVHATDFAEEYNITPKTVYRTLEDVAKSIQHKPFFYWIWRKNHYNERGVSWFSECEYMKEQGKIEIILDNAVLEMLTVFDKDNQYTKYQREYIAHLGAYGIVLFELIASCMFQKHKKKAYTIKYLRQKFDCVERYQKLPDFKKYVLDSAIKDIHEHTPYRITYTQKKEGREVAEIVFSFKDISQKKIEADNKQLESLSNKGKPSWQTKGLTDAQINKIAIYAEEFTTANSKFMSPSFRGGYKELIDSWRPMLKDPEKVNNFQKIQELLDRQATQ